MESLAMNYAKLHGNTENTISLLLMSFKTVRQNYTTSAPSGIYRVHE